MSAIVEEPRDDARHDAVIAIRSALTLGASLLGTWTVALLVRVLLPRWLGPQTFGAFNFADSFTGTFFIVLGLGVETYVQKEMPVRPEHASDFFGGVVVARATMAVLLLAAMMLVLSSAHRSPTVLRLVLVFGVGQLVFSINGTLAALLQAARTVNGLALVNVGAKIVWGAGVVAALILRLGLEALAVAFVFGEIVRLVVLAALARRNLRLRFRVDLHAVRAAVTASLPYYVNAIACTIYARVDITMLSMLSTDTEVGWYGAASNFAGLALLVAPLVGWVVMPMLSRAAARSQDELFLMLRRAIEAALLVALPTATLIGVGADVWIRRVFGEPFAPAVASLHLLAPMFVFTYVAMITATGLVLLRRPWTVAFMSITGLVLNPALCVALVPWGARTFGAGGAGIGAAIALLTTEIVVTTTLVVAVGRRAFDRRSARVLSLAVVACLGVVALDLALRSIGPARLVLDLLAWIALVLILRAVRTEELAPIARFVVRSRRSDVAAP